MMLNISTACNCAVVPLHARQVRLRIVSGWLGTSLHVGSIAAKFQSQNFEHTDIHAYRQASPGAPIPQKPTDGGEDENLDRSQAMSSTMHRIQ